jgi:hypothetical protein
MDRNSVKVFAASLVTVGMLGVPAVASAQSNGFDDESSVVVECGPGQRAVMAQRRINGTTQVVARCEAAQGREVVHDEFGQARPVAYQTSRPVARRSNVQYVERAPERTKTKTALMIAGSAATGAGVGGALKGKKGALIGAAVGGGAASIYEAAKRR